MKWFKFFAGVTVVSAATAAIAAKTIRDKKRQAELDEFLMPEKEDMVVVDIPTKNQDAQEKMQKDILSWEENGVQLPVTLKFKFEHFNEAHDFQELISKDGICSSLSDETRIISIQYNESLETDSLMNLITNINTAIKTKEIYYQGYDFTK